MGFDEERFRRELRDAAGATRARPEALDDLRARQRDMRNTYVFTAALTAIALVAVTTVVFAGRRPVHPPVGGSLFFSQTPRPSSPAPHRAVTLLPSAIPTPTAAARHDVKPNASVSEPALSSDASEIAFISRASNLVSHDTNKVADAFVRARGSHRNFRISIASDGTQANGETTGVTLSADGKHAAFVSSASNLVPDDTNGVADVFERDMTAHKTIRISVANDGAQQTASTVPMSGAAISKDGRYVAFESDAALVPGDTNGKRDVFVRDVVANTTVAVSVTPGGSTGNGASGGISMSASGRTVAFRSDASDLLANGADGNGLSDIFVRDLQTSTTTRASEGAAGQYDKPSYRPAISANGRYVVFAFGDDNANSQQIRILDRTAGAASADVTVATCDGSCERMAITEDGRRLFYEAGAIDPYCYLVTVGSPPGNAAALANDDTCVGGSMTPDGRYVGVSPGSDFPDRFPRFGGMVYDSQRDTYTDVWTW